MKHENPSLVLTALAQLSDSAPATLVAADTVQDTPAPTRFGDYLIESVIDEGGMGIVYRARHRLGGVTVALKTPSRRARMNSQLKFSDRFAREARAGRVRHPNVMPVTDAGVVDGRPFLVMPLARGSVHDRLSTYHRRIREAVRLIADAGRGVAALHAEDFIHRDLKPGNLLFDDDGQVRVSDMGLVKFLDAADGPTLTVNDDVLGTPAYMAPEMVRSDRANVGEASDVWSLGVILYELCTGKKPFVGVSAADTFHNVLKSSPLAASLVNPTVDSRLQAILDGCLAKDIKARYTSAAAMVADCDRWLANKTVRGAKPPRRRWSLGAAALLVGVVAGFLAAVAGGPGIAGSEPPFGPGKTGIPSPAISDWIRTEIGNGRPVTLIPESGPPLCPYTLFNVSSYRDFPPNGPPAFNVSNGRAHLVSLAPCAPASFRLDAEFRLIEGDGSGVGLFIGMTRKELKPGQQYSSWLAFYFDDFRTIEADSLAPNTSQTALVRFHDTPWVGVGKQGDYFGPGMPLYQSAAQAGIEPRWRRMSLTVTPKGVEPMFENRRAAVVVDEDMLKYSSVKFCLNSKLAPKVPDLDLRGEVGLFIASACVRVRNVVLTPLGDTKQE